MKKSLSLFLVLLLGTSLASGQAIIPATSQLKSEIQTKLDSLQQRFHFPGATFAAILPNGERISLATGVADSATMAPMRAKHRMLAGSNGKMFFVAAALLLEAQGHFDLDDPISKYLGDEPWFHRLPNASSVSIRMLLNHTSGIEEYYQLGDFMKGMEQEPYRTYTPKETFSYVFDREPLFEAGTDWSYADTNYLLLGYLMEKTSGENMYDLIERNILKPYELRHTEPSIKPSFDGLAVGYSGSQSPFPFHGAMVENDSLVFSPQFEWAGGGFVSNVEDLALWAKEFYNFNAIPAAKRAELHQGVAANTGKGHAYGLGVQIRPGGKFGDSYGHSGWFPGYVTDAVYFPEVDLALAIQFNTDEMRFMKIAPYSYLLEMAELMLK